ncbi:MAG: potassium-transporting ATPase subunit C [Leptospira sp.]|nr:potassium-transporting ATPase subunit C [Leptospira sp.]
MKILNSLLTNLRIVFLSIVILSILYPLTINLLGMTFWSYSASGYLVKDKFGKYIGSSMIAQKFSNPIYVFPRPSAVDYQANASGGSNWGSKNPELKERAENKIKTEMSEAEGFATVDSVTSSGSGLDPFITEDNLKLQLKRIAKLRNIEANDIAKLLNYPELYEIPLFENSKIFNVLKVNLYLDQNFPQ